MLCFENSNITETLSFSGATSLELSYRVFQKKIANIQKKIVRYLTCIYKEKTIPFVSCFKKQASGDREKDVYLLIA